jgi:hypothetical protein
MVGYRGHCRADSDHVSVAADHWVHVQRGGSVPALRPRRHDSTQRDGRPRSRGTGMWREARDSVSLPNLGRRRDFPPAVSFTSTDQSSCSNRSAYGLTTYGYLFSGNFSNITPRYWLGGMHSCAYPALISSPGPPPQEKLQNKGTGAVC